eukprot:3219189-Pleurochrysis_carterae.AAC.1
MNAIGIGRQGSSRPPWTALGMKQVLGSVLEETRADNEEVAEAMESSLPESEGHRTEVSPLESPTPEEWAERAKEAGKDCEIRKILAEDHVTCQIGHLHFPRKSY